MSRYCPFSWTEIHTGLQLLELVLKSMIVLLKVVITSPKILILPLLRRNLGKRKLQSTVFIFNFLLHSDCN